MQPKAILFDLDGTLLPMDQDTFIKAYFGKLVQKLAPSGYEPKALIDGIWAGTGAMIRNDGSRTNEQAFWDCFAQRLGEHVRSDVPLFEEYYRNEFQSVQAVCGFNAEAAALVGWLQGKGIRLILATNPIFPAIATQSRIRWAGLCPEDFELITSYENCRHSKPSLDYYRNILASQGLQAKDCLMVGNDVAEDMVAAKLGMQVFLLTDCLINKGGEDISQYPHGSFDALRSFIENM